MKNMGLCLWITKMQTNPFTTLFLAVSYSDHKAEQFLDKKHLFATSVYANQNLHQ